MKKIVLALLSIIPPVFVLVFLCQWDNGDISAIQCLTRSIIAIGIENMLLTLWNK